MRQRLVVSVTVMVALAACEHTPRSRPDAQVRPDSGELPPDGGEIRLDGGDVHDGGAGACASGTFDHDEDAATECVAWTTCDAGEHVVEEGSASRDRTCAGCTSGSFSAEENAHACVAWTRCEAGSYVTREGDATGDRECASCPSGTYTSGPNQSVCVPREGCAPGSVQTAPGTSTMPPTCARCAAGAYCPGGDLPSTACDADSWDDDADPATACVARTECVAGTHVAHAGSEVGDRSCAPCAAGTFSATSNAPSCALWTVCPAGEVEAAPGSSTSDRTCMSGWTRQFGTSTYDQVVALRVDASGNVIVAGEVTGILPGQTSEGGVDAFVRKYDAAGHVLWTRQFGFGHHSNDRASSVSVDASGNVLVAGETISNAGPVSAFVRKYDAAGDLVWSRTFGSTEWDAAEAVDVDGAGNVLVAGHTQGTLPGQTSAGATDAFVCKYDADGEVVWIRQFGTSGADVASGVSADERGNVVVVGETRGALPGQTSAGATDAFVRAYDAAGEVLWTRQLGSAAIDSALSVDTGASGSVVVAGLTGGEAFVHMLDARGEELWARQLGSSLADTAYSVSVDASGNVIVAGQVGGTLPGQTSGGGSDGFVRVYDPDGDELWTRQLGTSGLDIVYSARPGRSGAVLLAGKTDASFPGYTNLGRTDAFVMMLVP